MFTFTKLLLVTQTNLGAVVDLSAHKSILVQGVFAANSESSLILRRSPSQIDSGFQTRVHLLVNRSSENLKKIPIKYDPDFEKLNSYLSIIDVGV